MMITRRIIPSELIHIWKNEPCEAGDTLSGGSNVKDLLQLKFIESTDKGYVTTFHGKIYIQRLIELLDLNYSNTIVT